MKHFYIITRDIESSQPLIGNMVSEIEKRGGTCGIAVNPHDDLESEGLDLPKETQCIIAVGGDGTVIRAAQNTSSLNIPIIGVNIGHLGYLCDLDETSVFNAIDQLMAEEYEIEDRMLLGGHVEDPDGKRHHGIQALNDIVIVSENPCEVINLTVHINGQYLYTYDCDGIIFATPTGSTAYNLSANGPIVDPKTKMILLTPINPHTLNSRSIVLDSDDVLEVSVASRRVGDDPRAVVSFDGNHRQKLVPGQKLVVHKSKVHTRMIRLSKMNFLERISAKMQAGG